MWINVITLCSGYDSQCLALEELKRKHPDFDYNLVAWSEIDKDAIRSHNALFPQYKDRNVGDMTKADWSVFADEQIDLLTYSTPCTDISIAGLRKGMAEGSNTRSSILWSTRDCIKALQPKYLLMENVKGVTFKDNIPHLRRWMDELETMGYRNYWRVLNALDYGVPQNRERMFMVSVRKDIPKDFTFPLPVPRRLALADIFNDDKDLDERLFANDEQIKQLKKVMEDNEIHTE